MAGGSMVTYTNAQRNSLGFVHFRVRHSSLRLIFTQSFPINLEQLRLRLAMEPYSEDAAKSFKLNNNNHWLCRRQGLSLPVLPPTTPEARHYFFKKIRDYSALASTEGKTRINYELFAQEWNRSADGKSRFYITTEVLIAYSKTWEKASNSRASQALIAPQIEAIRKTGEIFAAPDLPFPEFIVNSPTQIEPRSGLIDLDNNQYPSSLSLEVSQSHQTHQQFDLDVNMPSSSSPPPLAGPGPSTMEQATRNWVGDEDVPHKRRRVVCAQDRKRKSVRSCRRCKMTSCSGNNDILLCRMPCVVPCKVCKQYVGCRGVDGGRKCTQEMLNN